jgi:hypothetical protein
MTSGASLLNERGVGASGCVQDDNLCRTGRTNASATTRAVKSGRIPRGTVPWNPTPSASLRAGSCAQNAQRMGHPRFCSLTQPSNITALFLLPKLGFDTANLAESLAGCHIHFFIAFRTVVNVFRHCVAAIATSPGKSVHPVGFRSTSVCLIVQTIPRSPYSFVRLE